MALDLSQLTPIAINLAGSPTPYAINIPEVSSPLAVYVVPVETATLSLSSTTPFIAPSGLTIM
jgi:hypothetical protein